MNVMDKHKKCGNRDCKDVTEYICDYYTRCKCKWHEYIDGHCLNCLHLKRCHKKALDK